ncbi:hypothetical protein [Polynucleobacter sp. 80A-SIGWE]|uniref:hypothetical protein n=1 Tax=Polynucleobacter sp. 80A-SIGWE TaxID=2689100 RepID=UPI001C0AFFF3|nr:hypothetical protein [Polynucleobacter sp. 80A-SIGWE]MBU3588522.1 hypothetical protein [Polynucleobacter sp. 80A-SIGWE]
MKKNIIYTACLLTALLIGGYFYYVNKPIEGLALTGECLPNGFRAEYQSKDNPRKFWAEQSKFIEADWKYYLQEVEVRKLEREQGKINEEFENKKLKAIGIDFDSHNNSKADKDLDELLKKIDEDDVKFYREMDIKQAKWTKRCFRHSQLQLEKSKAN